MLIRKHHATPRPDLWSASGNVVFEVIDYAPWLTCYEASGLERAWITESLVLTGDVKMDRPCVTVERTNCAVSS